MGWRKWSGRTDSMGETVSEMTDIITESTIHEEKDQWGLCDRKAPK